MNCTGDDESGNSQEQNLIGVHFTLGDFSDWIVDGPPEGRGDHEVPPATPEFLKTVG